MIEKAENIQEFILGTLADVFGVPVEKLSPGASLKDLGIDSLGGVELSLAVKKKYGVVFVAGEITVDFTIGDIAVAAAEKLAGAEGAVA